MEKKYLAKIIANDQEGLQMISACSAGAKVKVLDIKYLASNKVFLLSIERTKVETGQDNKKTLFDAKYFISMILTFAPALHAEIIWRPS